MAATKFTPERRAAILERVALGISQPDIAREVGLRLPTFRSWLVRGRREQAGDYHDFVLAYDAARLESKSRPEPMDEAELLLVVSEAARRGSVQAMKLRWEMICAERDADETESIEEPPLASLDELAERRAQRA